MFNETELNLLRMACLTAACQSREYGYKEQADAFHRLADKCDAPTVGGGEAEIRKSEPDGV